MRRMILFGLLLLWFDLATALPISGVEKGTAGFVGMAESGPYDTPTLVTNYGEFLGVFGGSTSGLANPWLAPSVAGFFSNGGQRLHVVRVIAADDASLIGIDGGPGARTGLQALLDVDPVSVIAIPGSSSQTVQASMIAHCENAGDRMAILDAASTADVSAVLAQRTGLGSVDGFAALYFPWVQAAPAGESLLLPPSGFVAGIYAGTDPPDSPVGTIATATAVNVTITNADQDLLNPQGINAIRFFAGQGVRVWGARTIATNPEWVFVGVRRTRLHLEESIQEGTEWAVFEVNDAILWAALESDVGDFLFDLYLQGWFQGTTAAESYFVRCDASTMTPADIAAGRTVIQVGFAPTRPSEFLVFEVVQQHVSSTAVRPVARRSFVLYPASPNPFNPRTSIRFELDRRQYVGLGVYDLAGRRVRVLEAGRWTDSGRHEISWDGRDDAGRSLASGVYLLKLSVAGETQLQKVSLIK